MKYGNAVFFVACSLILPVGFTYWLQTELLYHPQRYGSEYKSFEKTFISALAKHNFELKSINYSQGGQATGTAFLVAPKYPTRLWMIYGGNAMLALDFSDFLMHAIQRRDLSSNAFLLMDFPGYGDSKVSTTPENTLKNSLEALNVVEQKLGALELNGFGHSLGCAAVLQLAAERPVENIILSAPFLSIADMAVSLFPFLRVLPRRFILPLVRHNWDNEKAMQFALKQNGQSLHIVHGVQDEIVPYEHGVKLAKMAPDKITLHTSTGSSHNDILNRESALYAQLLEERDLKV